MKYLIMTNIMILIFYIIEVWHNHNLINIIDGVIKKLSEMVSVKNEE